MAILKSELLVYLQLDGFLLVNSSLTGDDPTNPAPHWATGLRGALNCLNMTMK
jgi:hypothetical protein